MQQQQDFEVPTRAVEVYVKGYLMGQYSVMQFNKKIADLRELFDRCDMGAIVLDAFATQKVAVRQAEEACVERFESSLIKKLQALAEADLSSGLLNTIDMIDRRFLGIKRGRSFIEKLRGDHGGEVVDVLLREIGVDPDFYDPGFHCNSTLPCSVGGGALSKPPLLQ